MTKLKILLLIEDLRRLKIVADMLSGEYALTLASGFYDASLIIGSQAVHQAMVIDVMKDPDGGDALDATIRFIRLKGRKFQGPVIIVTPSPDDEAIFRAFDGRAIKARTAINVYMALSAALRRKS